MGSDHRAVKSLFSFILPDLEKRRRKSLRKGWKPSFDENNNSNYYYSEIDRRLQSHSGAPTLH